MFPTRQLWIPSYQVDRILIQANPTDPQLTGICHVAWRETCAQKDFGSYGVDQIPMKQGPTAIRKTNNIFSLYITACYVNC
jgi:hypothetical protein